MFTVEMLFMITSAILSAALLGFSAWSIVKSRDMIGSSINVGLSVLVLCSFFGKVTSMKQGLICMANPVFNVLKWFILSAVIAYLIWDAYQTLNRKGTV